MVMIPGTSTGALGDDKGNFAIECPQGGKIKLVFIAEGFEIPTVDVERGKENIIYLKPASQ